MKMISKIEAGYIENAKNKNCKKNVLCLELIK